MSFAETGFASGIASTALRLSYHSTLGLRIIKKKRFRVTTQRDLRRSTSQKCAAVPRSARIQGSLTFVSLNSRLASNEEVSLNSRLESNKEEEEGSHHHTADLKRHLLNTGIPSS